MFRCTKPLFAQLHGKGIHCGQAEATLGTCPPLATGAHTLMYPHVYTPPLGPSLPRTRRPITLFPLSMSEVSLVLSGLIPALPCAVCAAYGLRLLEQVTGP